MRQESDSHSRRRILLTGSTGLVGTALGTSLQTRGDKIVSLVRQSRRPTQDTIPWEANRPLGPMETKKIGVIHAVVNLAGEPIFGRFTKEKKHRIRNSRISLTRNLCEGLAALEEKPRVLVSASAVGIYAPNKERDQDEWAQTGDAFLSHVCRDWEAATQPAQDAGIRVVNLRIAPVLSTKGGMLKVMLIPARMNLIGRVGDGMQYMSWIALGDLVSLILHGIDNDGMRGPVNAAAPNPVTNATFTDTLAATLGKWKGPPVPEFIAKLALGREAAEEMMLKSLKVVPRRAVESGFQFALPHLDVALKHILSNAV
ncbi:TIGR01777 family protein [Candidatus Sumerlaeota bacterium]|nr:TIGR01777 family protein [Candidatus Sumerlaeota bacterium]